MSRPTAGQPAPRFAATDAHGRTVRLDDLLERGPVVLVFYRGHWCPFCRRHLRKLQGNLERIRERGSELVAVSVDEPELSRRLADELGLEFPLLSDPESRVVDAYDLRNRLLGTSSGIPHASVFVIDSGGTVRFGEVRHNYKRRVTPSRILRELDQVADGEARR